MNKTKRACHLNYVLGNLMHKYICKYFGAYFKLETFLYCSYLILKLIYIPFSGGGLSLSLCGYISGCVRVYMYLSLQLFICP